MYRKLGFLLIALLSSFNTISAQDCNPGEISCIIEFQTDNYGNEFSWEILDTDGMVLFESPEDLEYDNFTYYEEKFCIGPDQCIQIIFRDFYGDGFTNGGYGRFLYDGEVLFSVNNYGYAYSKFFNCEPGYTCEDPFEIVSTSFTLNFEERWYTMEVDSIGLYEISTCDNPDGCDTKIYIYNDCPVDFDDSVEGTLFYNDENEECGQRARTMMSLAPNRKYIVRIVGDLESCESEIQVEINYLGPISGCTDPTACNYDPLSTIDNGSCIDFNDPDCPEGPDLRLNPFVLASSMRVQVQNNTDECLVEEGCLRGVGPRDVIAFSTRIENIGTLDYFIGEPDFQPDQFTFDNCHNHYHYDGYAEYSFYDTDGQYIPIGTKNGFCVLDLECPSAIPSKYTCDNMGITAGCADIYDSNIKCQWLDITDIPDGDYVFVAVVNVDLARDALGRAEKDTLNNFAQVCINISRETGSIEITKYNECEPYVDCTGEIYGNALQDCEGNCDGTRRRGDRNLDQTLDMLDVETYISDILTREEATECSDLFSDEEINVFDAALLQSCIRYGLEHEHDSGTTAHNHCFFPGGINNQLDSMFLEVKYDIENDPEQIYIDITNAADGLSAFQLELDGVEIEEVYQNTVITEQIFEFHYNNETNILVGMPVGDQFLERSNVQQSLIKIKVTPTDSTFCFVKDPILISNNAQMVASKLINPCIDINYSSIESIVDAAALSVYPIPAKDVLHVVVDQSGIDVENVTIMNVNGEIVYDSKTNLRALKIDVKNWTNGMYILRVSGEKEQYIKKFIIQHAK